MPRFRVRTMMIAVAGFALLLAAIGPCRGWYRRWSYHRAQASWFARMEAKERGNYDRSMRAAADREAIKSKLIQSPGFAGKNTQEIEQSVERMVDFHKQQADQSLGAANRWAEQKRDSRTAAFWSFDPFAPGVP